jgi:hypothetical protein
MYGSFGESSFSKNCCENYIADAKSSSFKATSIDLRANRDDSIPKTSYWLFSSFKMSI